MTTFSFSRTLTSGKPKSGHALVILLDESLKLSTAATALDKATGGAISRALAASSFKGKTGQVLSVVGIDGVAADRALLLGIGANKDADARAFEDAGGNAMAHLLGLRVTSAEAMLDSVKAPKIKDAEAAAHFAYGAKLRSYSFTKYRTTLKPEQKRIFTALCIVTKDEVAAKKAFAPLATTADGVFFTRDLVTEPANILYPESFAEHCKKLTKLGVKVEILGLAQLKKLGMGALIGVAQGSVREPKLVVMQWLGGKKGDKPAALIGKGVCFDTGGISIKPAGGMEEMKWDMAGAGAVVGTMHALASRKAKANVVGVIGLVENMPDGNAQRPGDVVTSMSGQTIEVLNTDAEGRLVLADAVWYTQARFKPKAMVDLATLTGAIIIALGSHKAGLFTQDDKLAKQLGQAGDETGEKLWRMPMGPEYDEMINCDIADMKNISDGREAGSTTAAHFIERFTNKVPWAHLDIAGVAWKNKPTALHPKGAVGWGVRLLNAWIAKEFEK